MMGGDGSNESDEVDEDDERGAEIGGSATGAGLGELRGVLEGVESREAPCRRPDDRRQVSERAGESGRGDADLRLPWPSPFVD